MNMSNELKYTLKKNKNKILIGIGIVLFVGIGAGSYFFFNQPEKSLTGLMQNENRLAKYIVSGTENGKLSLLDVESEEIKQTLSLPEGEYIYSINADYDTLYAYDGKTIRAFDLKKDGLTEKGEISTIEAEGVLAFQTDGKNIALLSNDGQTLTYQYEKDGETKTETIESVGTVDDFHIHNGILFYSSNTNLYTFSPTSETSIDLGDQTDVITDFQEQLLVHNRFGSGLHNSILLSLHPDDLKITDLKEMKSETTSLLAFDGDDESFYTSKYVNATVPYHELEKWTIRDGKIVKDQEVSVHIPAGENGITYDHETTVASEGYLYTHYLDRIQIYDVRAQKVYKTLKTEEYFAVPVLTE